MAFDNEDFAVVGSAPGPSPTIHSYFTEDTRDDVFAVNYFADKKLSLDTGDVIYVKASDGTDILEVTRNNGIISTSVLSKPSNWVVVNTKDDFPSPVGGVIQLDNFTVYVLGKSVDIGTDYINLGISNTITAFNLGITLSYQGTGAMIRGGDFGQFTASFMGMDAPLGSFFLLEDVLAPNTSFVIIDTVSGNRCVKYGTLKNLAIWDMSDSGTFGATGDGITFDGPNWNNVFIAKTGFITPGASFIGWELTSTFTVRTLTFDSLIVAGDATATAISGAANSANIVANSIASVTNCNFGQLTTPLVGITKSDVRWDFQNNSGVPNSTLRGDVYLTTPETVTINTIGVFEAVAGGNWLSDISEMVSVDSNGIITYLLEDDREVFISATATVEKAGGGSDELEIRIALDTGSGFTTQAKTGSTTENGTPTSVTAQGLFNLSLNDKIQLFIANNSTTTNAIVNISNMLLI